MPRAMLLAALAAGVLTGTLIPPLAAWARRRNYLDIPNHRSSHVVATPRIGGIALVLGVVAGAAVLHLFGGGLDRGLLTVLGGALGIALLGLIDDFQQLSPLVRLVVQTAIAAAVVFAGSGSSATGDALVPGLLAVFWLVTLINAFNFMDGIDGIAGAQALVAGCGWVAVSVFAGVPQIFALGLLVAAASIGFLLHNWHPAKVFMGDAGSGFFGFLLAAMPLLEPDRNGGALWLCAVLLMWPFLADTGITLIRRAIRGENILSAHRSHIYQRLVVGGRSHSYVTLVYAGLAVLGIVASIAVVLATRTWV